MIVCELPADEEHKFGKGFKGAIDYLLKGKKGQENPERVTYHELVNLMGDIRSAALEMRLTADYRAALLKRKPSEKDKDGRDVYHFTISWKPEENPPEGEGMADHARQILALIGLADHEAVIVAHGDTDNPHVHVIVNRVNPLTGTKWKSWQAQKVMNDYAARWMKANGIELWQQGAGNGKRRNRKAYEREQAAKRAVELAALPAAVLDTLTKHQSTFTDAQLAKAVTDVTATPQEFAELLGKVIALPDLLRLSNDQGATRYTSSSLRAAEERIAENAGHLAGRIRHTIKASVRDAALARFGGDDQAQAREALEHLLDPRGLSVVVGYAGAGKSTLLRSAAEAWKASGYTVRGLALAGRAAEGLEFDAGINAGTIAAFLLKMEKGTEGVTARDVFVIDETGMVGSRQMDRLLQIIGKAGAKVVMVGDPEQLQAIDAGGPFGYIVNHFEHACLNRIWRQQAEWMKMATIALAEGRTIEALDIYHKEGMAHGHNDKDGAIASILDEWQAGRDIGGTQIILTATNADAGLINGQARARLAAAGALGNDNAFMTTDGLTYFATGDRLLFKKNDRTLGVKNGTAGTVRSTEDGKIVVVLDTKPPHSVAIDPATYGHFTHGYAVTMHKAQGVTVDRAFVLASRFMNRHAAYVALSRHRQRVAFHWCHDDFKSWGELTRRMNRAGLKETSLNYRAEVRAIAMELTAKIVPADTEDQTTAWHRLYQQQRAEAAIWNAMSGIARAFWFAANSARYVWAGSFTLSKIHRRERAAMAEAFQKIQPNNKKKSAAKSKHRANAEYTTKSKPISKLDAVTSILFNNPI